MKQDLIIIKENILLMKLPTINSSNEDILYISYNNIEKLSKILPILDKLIVLTE